MDFFLIKEQPKPTREITIVRNFCICCYQWWEEPSYVDIGERCPINKRKLRSDIARSYIKHMGLVSTSTADNMIFEAEKTVSHIGQFEPGQVATPIRWMQSDITIYMQVLKELNIPKFYEEWNSLIYKITSIKHSLQNNPHGMDDDNDLISEYHSLCHQHQHLSTLFGVSREPSSFYDL